MKLVVIEAPAKRETLKKYLGNGYEVFATKGHIRDLPVKSFAIDINNNFEPHYENKPDKKELISELKRKAEKADDVFSVAPRTGSEYGYSGHGSTLYICITPHKCTNYFQRGQTARGCIRRVALSSGTGAQIVITGRVFRDDAVHDKFAESPPWQGTEVFPVVQFQAFPAGTHEFFGQFLVFYGKFEFVRLDSACLLSPETGLD